MSVRSKKYVVYAALLVLAVWPAVHICLVKRFDLSPWKLAGWGMYSTPRLGFLGMEIYGRSDAQHELEKLTAPPAPLRAEASAFLERYRWLRRLARPDSLARAVKQIHPQWQELQVTVFQPVLDAPSGMIVMTSVVYHYPEK